MVLSEEPRNGFTINGAADNLIWLLVGVYSSSSRWRSLFEEDPVAYHRVVQLRNVGKAVSKESFIHVGCLLLFVGLLFLLLGLGGADVDCEVVWNDCVHV